MASFIAAYIFAIYPYVDNKAKVPELIKRYKEEANAAKFVHTVGINSAIIDFYTGFGVHPTDHLDYAIKRANKGDIIIGINKAKRLNNGKELPPNYLMKFKQGKFDYVIYKK